MFQICHTEHSSCCIFTASFILNVVVVLPGMYMKAHNMSNQEGGKKKVKNISGSQLRQKLLSVAFKGLEEQKGEKDD